METQAIDARFDALEGKLEAQGQATAEHFVEMQNFVVHHVTRLREDMNTGFARVDERFGQVDERFGQVDGRFGQVDGRLDQIDGRLDKVDGRLDQIDGRLDKVDGHLNRFERRLDRHEDLLGEILVEVRSLKRD